MIIVVVMVIKMAILDILTIPNTRELYQQLNYDIDNTEKRRTTDKDLARELRSPPTA